MKKIAFGLLLVMVLIGWGAGAQTTLYKTYVGRTGIKATCIENYPIGKGMKVRVTMLEAQDSTAFRHLMQSLKSLPYSGDKTKSNRGLESFAHNLDSLPVDNPKPEFGEALAKGLLRYAKRMDLEINDLKDTNHRENAKSMKLNLVCADPLPGDEGLYLIYNSSDMMTALVFHCPDEQVYEQTIVYVLKYTMKKWSK